MRLFGRLYIPTDTACSIPALGLLFTLSACSLPDVDIDKQQKRAMAGGNGFYARPDDHAIQDLHSGDSSYVATVRIGYTETGNQSVTFDVRRDKRDLVSFNLEESTQTSTYLHLGFTHSEGGIAGLRFNWRF